VGKGVEIAGSSQVSDPVTLAFCRRAAFVPCGHCGHLFAVSKYWLLACASAAACLAAAPGVTAVVRLEDFPHFWWSWVGSFFSLVELVGSSFFRD
jgi:hypothetical protein